MHTKYDFTNVDYNNYDDTYEINIIRNNVTDPNNKEVDFDYIPKDPESIVKKIITKFVANMIPNLSFFHRNFLTHNNLQASMFMALTDQFEIFRFFISPSYIVYYFTMVGYMLFLNNYWVDIPIL